MMKRGRGFTLIEVSLFLAISGLLFFAITLGVQNSIRQQRYNDSVQSFAEFLRGVYSEVLNVQSNGGEDGRSDKAIYGKLITTDNGKDFTVYNVVGDIDDDKDGDLLGVLKELKADIKDDGGYYGATETYKMKWAAAAQDPDGSSSRMVLIVRDPKSGIVNTLYVDNKQLEDFNSQLLTSFKPEQIDFCVNPEPEVGNNMRRDVRIVKDARNTSGVEVVADDAEGNRCKGS